MLNVSCIESLHRASFLYAGRCRGLSCRQAAAARNGLVCAPLNPRVAGHVWKIVAMAKTVDTAPAHTNRLAREKSPYLLQHAHNPVDWRAWGDEAFEQARR